MFVSSLVSGLTRFPYLRVLADGPDEHLQAKKERSTVSDRLGTRMFKKVPEKLKKAKAKKTKITRSKRFWVPGDGAMRDGA